MSGIQKVLFQLQKEGARSEVRKEPVNPLIYVKFSKDHTCCGTGKNLKCGGVDFIRRKLRKGSMRRETHATGDVRLESLLYKTPCVFQQV